MWTRIQRTTCNFLQAWIETPNSPNPLGSPTFDQSAFVYFQVLDVGRFDLDVLHAISPLS